MTAKILQIPVCCCRPALQMFTRLDVGAAAGPVLSLAGPDGENENFQTSCSQADVRCLKRNQSPPMSLMRSHPGERRYGRGYVPPLSSPVSSDVRYDISVLC